MTKVSDRHVTFSRALVTSVTRTPKYNLFFAAALAEHQLFGRLFHSIELRRSGSDHCVAGVGDCSSIKTSTDTLRSPFNFYYLIQLGSESH